MTAAAGRVMDLEKGGEAKGQKGGGRERRKPENDKQGREREFFFFDCLD